MIIILIYCAIISPWIGCSVLLIPPTIGSVTDSVLPPYGHKQTGTHQQHHYYKGGRSFPGISNDCPCSKGVCPHSQSWQDSVCKLSKGGTRRDIVFLDTQNRLAHVYLGNPAQSAT